MRDRVFSRRQIHSRLVSTVHNSALSFPILFPIQSHLGDLLFIGLELCSGDF